ncbi:nitroreductase family protein [Streptomyces sp. NPDC057575]|uniref:nitroreductase family protein n=1 Tax=unclassified Streptomyces TaxID=2593676 RepID=UPI003676E2B5
MATELNVMQDQEVLEKSRILLGRGENLWNRMSLVSPSTPSRNPVAPLEGLATALHTVEAAVAVDTSSGNRAVPSAGSIYPYEFYAVVAGDRGCGVIAIDPVRRLCWSVGTGGAGVVEQCRRAGIAPPPPGGADVVLVARPWLSMRKYGDRGYLYTQLDAAHVAVNLLGMSEGRGELLLRFGHGPLEELLGLKDRCREVHSVLRVEPGDDSALPAGWTVEAAVPASGAAAPSWLERVCWESLTPAWTAGEVEAPCRGARPLATPVESSGPAVELAAGKWAGLSHRRRSSKKYVPSALPAGVLAQVLATAGTALRTDLPPDSDLGVTVVARSAEGMPARVLRLTGGPVPGGGEAPDGDLIVRSCMQQEHLRDGAAFVVFHAPRASLASGRSPRAKELFLRAGGVAQLLYLGATAVDLGVTAVGGFDAGLWRTIGRLPEHHDPIYVLSFGATGSGGVKWDRMPVAYAQSER